MLADDRCGGGVDVALGDAGQNDFSGMRRTLEQDVGASTGCHEDEDDKAASCHHFLSGRAC